MTPDKEKCERCKEPGVGFNDDGEFLCEDCLFDDEVESNPEFEDDHL